MQTAQSGTRRFSFTSFISSAVPNLGFSRQSIEDLSPAEKDAVFTCQVNSEHPTYLDPETFQLCSIVNNERDARRTYEALVKLGILTAVPGSESPTIERRSSLFGFRRKSSTPATHLPSSTANPGPPLLEETASPHPDRIPNLNLTRTPTTPLPLNTSLITSTFPHKLSHLSVHLQRRLIHLLFFWEEELMRWRVLDSEIEELRSIEAAMTESGGGGEEGRGVAEVRVRLEQAERVWRMRPSLREENRRVGEVGEELPAYEK